MKALQSLAALGIGAVVSLGGPLAAETVPSPVESESPRLGDRERAISTRILALVPQAAPALAQAPAAPVEGPMAEPEMPEPETPVRPREAVDPVEQQFIREAPPALAPEATPSVETDSVETDSVEAQPPAAPVPETGSEPVSATSLIDRQPSLLRPTSPDEVSITVNEPITLETAIETARQNNPRIRARQLQIERSQSVVDEAKAAYAPTFSVNGSVNQDGTVTDTERLYPETTGFGQTGDSLTRSATVSLGADAQVNYNILDPARRARVEAAELEVQQASLGLARDLAQIRLDVSQAYYALQDADEQVGISEQAVRSAQTSLRDATALRNAGVGTQFSVLQAEVQLANEQQNLVNGLSAQQKARRQLAQVLSVPEKLNLTAADPVQPAGSWESTLEESIVQAYANRVELDDQLLNRQISDARRTVALARTRPTLSAFAQVGPSLRFDFSRTNPDPGDSEAQGIRRASLGYQTGLRFQWLFADGGASQAAARQQELNQAIAAEEFASQRDAVRREVEDAFYDLAANLRNIDTATQGVAQAEEALRLARLRLQAGVGTQTEVVDAERDLTTARGNRVRAVLNYNRALVQMRRAVGQGLPAPEYRSPEYVPAN